LVLEGVQCRRSRVYSVGVKGCTTFELRTKNFAPERRNALLKSALILDFEFTNLAKNRKNQKGINELFAFKLFLPILQNLLLLSLL